MSKLDTFRLFVDERLAAATDDIFRRFARIIAEYEGEVSRLKQEVDRKERLLERTGRPEDRTEDTLFGVQIFPLEEESQAKQSFRPNFQQDEGGALRPEGADTKFSECSDWLREGPEPDQSPLSNEIHNFREEVGLRPSINKQDAAIVKQEVGDGYLMVESAARSERSPQQKAVQQTLNTEEERQATEGYFSLHIKPAEDRASGLHDGVAKLTQAPDWPMETCKDEGSASNQIHFHGEEGFCHSDHSIGSAFQSEPCSDEGHEVQLDLDLQTTVGNGTPPPGDQNLLVCGSCGREFSSKQTLNKHIRQNTSQDRDQMSCSRRRQRAPFQNPVKSFRCSVCGGFFSTQGILVRHAEIHCKEPESQCGACGDYLGSTEMLRDHLRSHKELGRTCDVCGKKCSSIKRMEIHKRVHTGEKPYSCGFCCRDFSRKESLERHLQVHSGDRPHSCGLCWRTFTRREYLVQHLRTGHKESQGPSEETKLSCTTPAGGDSVA